MWDDILTTGTVFNNFSLSPSTITFQHFRGIHTSQQSATSSELHIRGQHELFFFAICLS